MFNQASTLLPKHTHAAAPQLTSPLLNLYLPSVALLSIILILVSTSVSSTAQAATPFTTNANFSVGSDGSANYSIPIQVPPGTAGMAPTLSLNYNSNGGNGILGMGWGLDGLSQISRCPKTIIQDGAVGGVNYDVNDKLCIDGQRLISTGGTYGGNATEYRTEQANFAKIISYTTTPANGPNSFKVWTKAGQIIEYGNTADSRIEAAAKTVVRTWGVNKISDTKGNYLTITYTEDSPNGEAYIQRIDYTGNATSTPVLAPYANVQFTYETRPDPSTGYHTGSVIKSTKRITNIKTYTNSTTMVKDYRLTYQLAPNTQRSRLATLTECAADTACLNPTVMNWRDTTAGTLTSNANYAPPTQIAADTIPELGTRFVDLNGDGLQDFVFARYTNATTNYRLAWLNTGSGWVSAPNYAPPTHISADTIPELGARFVDLNGDGLQDFVSARYTNATTEYRLAWLNTGSGWVSAPQYAPPTHIAADTIPELGARFVDLNGDGLQDFVSARFTNATTNYRLAWLNTGNGWVSAPQYAPPTQIAADTIPELGTRFVDLNGDGLPDFVFARYVNATTNYRLAWLNTGNGWVSAPNYAPPTHISADTIPELGTRFVDLNGDGLLDFVFARYVNATTNYRLAWLNTGSGWVSESNYAPPTHIAADTIPNLGADFIDLNGDGLQDFVFARYITATNNYREAYLNTGNGWVSAPNYAPPTHIAADTIPNLGADFVDLNGDGLQDFVMARYVNTTTNYRLAWLNTATRDALVSITPGLGSTTSLTYKPITDSTVYVKDAIGATGTTTCPMPLGNNNVTNSYPIINLQEPQYVVSTATDSDGNGGVLTNNYNYGGLKAHLTGRGSLGFRYQKVTQVDPDVNSTTFFRQDYPYIGLPCQTEKKITSNNTLIGASALTYANSPITTGTAVSQFPYLSQSVEQNFELGGTLINTTTTTNQYDAFGNATQISVNSGDGYIKTTTNVYNNDSTNWLLGRLLKSTVTSTTP